MSSTAAAGGSAQQGIAVPVRHRDPARVRLPPAHGLQGAPPGRQRQRRRVLLPATPRHRALRRGGHPRRRHHRPRPAASTPARRPKRCCRSSSVAAGSASPARTACTPSWPTSPAPGSPRRTSASCARSSRSAASMRPSTRLDGAVESSIQLGVADVIADVVETGQHAAPGRPGDVRRDHPRVRGGADHPRRAGPGRLRDLPAPDRGRPRGPQLRDDGLRHPRARSLGPPWRSRPASRARRSAAASEGWVAVRAMVRRDGAQRLMDELYDIGARASCSPTSMPAGSDLRAAAAHLAPARRADRRRGLRRRAAGGLLFLGSPSTPRPARAVTRSSAARWSASA